MTRSGPVVAFQGELGSFSEQAVHCTWEGAAIPLPQRDSQRVVDAVARGAADFGVLPIANTIAGEVVENRSVIAGNHLLREEGTITLDIVQSLLAIPGARIPQLRSVASHPIALAQCSRFFAQHRHLRPVESYDTAGAARDVAAHRSLGEAAIASSAAAERYGLQVLLDDVSDSGENRTTFVILAADGTRSSRRAKGRRDSESSETSVGKIHARLHAIRGATTVRADNAAEICDA
ncbi:MAG: hypothetical protein M3403_05710, partial [Gemmatimonadota bacterium]|nr:hypothetical protein [Gemmatimonadota bacterium]